MKVFIKRFPLLHQNWELFLFNILYKIIQIVHTLWLAIKPFYMSVCKHGFHSSFISYFLKEMWNGFCVYIAWCKHLRGWENTRQAGNHSASHRGFLRLSRVLPTSCVFTSGYVNTETILHFFTNHCFDPCEIFTPVNSYNVTIIVENHVHEWIKR